MFYLENRVMSIGVDNPQQYTDEREKLDYFLKTEEDVLFRWLGKRAFLIERDGYYNPRIILEMDFLSRGKEIFRKYIELVKAKICPHWKQMRESGFFSDMKDIYSAVLGALLGQNVHYALAVIIANIVARRGLDKICEV